MNVDCKPDVLDQYGLIGSAYAEAVLAKANPRVALLNIGEESEKGNLTTKAAYELMADKLNYEFVGGTAVLGINAVVLIGHGRSSALAIQNMVRQTEKTVKSGLVNKLQDTFRNF